LLFNAFTMLGCWKKWRKNKNKKCGATGVTPSDISYRKWP
jgi:hypothetical protein